MIANSNEHISQQRYVQVPPQNRNIETSHYRIEDSNWWTEFLFIFLKKS